MLKQMTLIAAATMALYGCGGGSSDGNKGPQNNFDYPIKNATFAPVETTKLGYAFAVDEQPAGSMMMNFKPISAQDLVNFAEQDPDAAIVAPIINDLINNGITQFYLSTQDIEDKPESEENLYFAGTDGALHEFNDTFLVDHKLISLVMNSSPLFRLEGSTVKDKDPNINISAKKTIKLRLRGEQVANLLDNFSDHEWVQKLPDDASCQTVWIRKNTETGARKTFHVSGKSIEAAYLTEKNTYNLRCDGMDSMEFESSAERWFNPALGLIEQVELLKAEQTQISEEKATLSKIEKA
jgi:hypothetical protein